MDRVYIKTYGCQMNERDSDAVAVMLRNKGYSIVSSEDDADVILLNTCSVREQAEQKAIGKTGHLLKKGKRKNPNLIVGVMGCMAQNRGTALLDSLPDLDLLVGTQKFHQIPDHLDNLIATMKGRGPTPSTIVDLEEEKDSQNTIREHATGIKTPTAFVSIMQGCNMKCTYCIVPTTRGEERARPMQDILNEVEELAANGTKEVTLLGQIVNAYARRELPHIAGKSPFVQLLEAVHQIKGIERIRFTSPHPSAFKPDLVEAYRDLPKLCNYVHLPLQSGSDRVLKAMKRPYSVEKFERIVTDLRAVAPDMHFSTDIIVGFPGEEEEDFAMTRDLFDKLAFDMAYVFKYSMRPGTEGEKFGDPIPKEVKEERNQILLKILEKHSLSRSQAYIGKTTDVLIEGPAKRGDLMFVGRTPGNRKVIFPATERLIGEIVPVQITDGNASSLFGDMIVIE